MKKPRRRLPPLWLWILWLPLFAVLGYVQLGDVGDSGMRNAFTMLSCMLLFATGWLWLVFLSGFAGKLRLLIGVGVVVLVGGCNALFRIDGFSGSMIPELSARFGEGRARPDLVAVEGAEVDLDATTPEDFPGFLGRLRNGRVASTLDSSWPEEGPEVLWRHPVGAGWSGFAVVNGVAVTMEQWEETQVVTAYDVDTGALLWSHPVPGHFNHFLGGEGPRSTPTIDGGRVYALGAFGRISCLDGATGELIWERDLLADFGITPEIDSANLQYGRSNSPLVVGDLLIIPGGGDEGTRLAGLVAYDKNTGEVIWEGPPRQISFSSPTVATLGGVEQILIVNEDTVSGHLVKTGALLWEHEWPGRSANDANCSQAVPVGQDRVFVSKGYGAGSMLLELLPAEDGLFEARPVWRNRRSMRTKFTNVVMAGEHVYGLSDGMLECIALETGERAWRDGRYGHGQVLLAGELLVVLSEEGEVLLIEASPEKENSVVARFQGVEGKTWNTFALYGDLLVLRNGEEAGAFRLPRAGE